MIKLSQLCAYLEEFLESKKFTDYCPNGLQIEGKEEIKKIAFAVSASEAAILAAIESGADALIVHHGIFWNKDQFSITGVKRKKIAALLQHNMSLIAYHLPLDAHPLVGNNWKAALELQWTNIEPFYAGERFPLGVKGKIAPISRQNFQRQLEDYYNHKAFVALGGKEMVETVALISGGAWRYLTYAVQEGVDCFITGSYDEPAWDIAHEEKINFFALGHWATETIGIQALLDHLKEKFAIEASFLSLPNPF